MITTWDSTVTFQGCLNHGDRDHRIAQCGRSPYARGLQGEHLQDALKAVSRERDHLYIRLGLLSWLDLCTPGRAVPYVMVTYEICWTAVRTDGRYKYDVKWGFNTNSGEYTNVECRRKRSQQYDQRKTTKYSLVAET